MHDRVDSTRVTGGRVCWLSIDISPDSLCVRLLASCPTTIFIIERGDDLFSPFIFFFSFLFYRQGKSLNKALFTPEGPARPLLNLAPSGPIRSSGKARGRDCLAHDP